METVKTKSSKEKFTTKSDEQKEKLVCQLPERQNETSETTKIDKKNADDSGIIYVISDGDKQGLFKVGKYVNDIKALKTRYISYIPNLVIHHIEEVTNRSAYERGLLRLLHEYRKKNINGNISEWVACDLETIIAKIEYLKTVNLDDIPDPKKLPDPPLPHYKKIKDLEVEIQRLNNKSDELSSDIGDKYQALTDQIKRLETLKDKRQLNNGLDLTKTEQWMYEKYHYNKIVKFRTPGDNKMDNFVIYNINMIKNAENRKRRLRIERNKLEEQAIHNSNIF